LFGSRKKRATGIHIGDDALNVVEMSSSSREGAKIEGLVSLDLDRWPLSVRLSRDDVSHQLLEALRRSVDEYDLNFPSPLVALDPSLVSVKRRALIPGSDEENREYLKWEATQFLSDDLDHYLLDFLLTTQFGFVVAVRRVAVEKLRSLCKDAGVAKPRFDAVPFALCNALEFSGGSLEGVDLVIDIGDTEARLVLLNKGELQALESCNWWDGGLAMYMDAFSYSPGSKQDTGGKDFGKDRVANHASDDRSQAQLLSAALAGFVDRWADGKTPDRVWIAGRDADSPQWGAAVASTLSIPGEFLNPFAAVEGSEEIVTNVNAPAFAVAAGLAFRGLAGD
jgi:Tfp pilus assembly PilM family ATPase